MGNYLSTFEGFSTDFGLKTPSSIEARAQGDLDLPMWVPGKLPANLVFLISVTQTTAAAAGGDGSASDPGDAVAADAADEAAHFQDTECGEHTVHRQTARLGDFVDQ